VDFFLKIIYGKKKKIIIPFHFSVKKCNGWGGQL